MNTFEQVSSDDLYSEVMVTDMSENITFPQLFGGR